MPTYSDCHWQMGTLTMYPPLPVMDTSDAEVVDRLIQTKQTSITEFWMDSAGLAKDAILKPSASQTSLDAEKDLGCKGSNPGTILNFAN